MKALYHRFFHIPSQGKIREKVLVTRITLSVFLMILCMSALSLIAYAYFSADVSSGNNTIQAANYDLVVTVGETKVEDLTQPFELKKGEHTVTIQRVENSATTGFCVICCEGATEEYHTQQIGKDCKTDEIMNEITFTIVAEGDIKVTFDPHWGTSKYYGTEESTYYVKNGETLTLGTVNPPSDQSGQDVSSQSEAPSSSSAVDSTISSEQDKAEGSTSSAVTASDNTGSAASTVSSTESEPSSEAAE